MDQRQILDRLSAARDDIRNRFGVKGLSVFGSVARNEATETSDLDLLVDFVEPATFDGYMDLKYYLEDLIGGTVDLVTRQAVRPQLRGRIEREAIDVS